MRRILLIMLLPLLWALPASAQTPGFQYLCIWNGTQCNAANGGLVSAANPLPVTATFSPGAGVIAQATASATPTAVSAGTGKPINIDLFSELFVRPSIGGTPVDATHGLPSLLLTGSTTAVTQTTSPWIVAGGGTAGSAATGVVTVQGIAAMTPLLVSLSSATTGGCTPYHLANGSAASTNSTNIKGSAGTLCEMTVINTTATIYYLKIYNASSAPTCSSATGLVHVYPIPASATGAGIQRSVPLGEAYGTGIGFCLTASGTDTANDNAATGVFIEASYK